jgi:murein L,D-transpeptidase YcbB/YkuD
MDSFSRGRSPLNRLRRIGLAGLALALAAPVTTSLARVEAASVQSAQAAEVNAFYRSRGGAPLWLSPGSGTAAQQLVQLLSTAQADNLNPRRYNVRSLTRALAAARTGNPVAVQRAEVALSQAFVAFVDDQKRDPHVGIVYVDRELKPAPPSGRFQLTQAASAPSLSDYVQQMGWMNPIYA